ncbi:MAG: DUF983 domain-containing protein [Rhodospirillales bacterium]
MPPNARFLNRAVAPPARRAVPKGMGVEDSEGPEAGTGAAKAGAEAGEPARAPLGRTLVRGMKRLCPACGQGRLFRAYLKPVSECAFCGEALGEIRADDFPPYITMFIVGHLIVPLVLAAERIWQPPVWAHMAVWPALSLVLVLALLAPVKGACIAVMWRLRMTGNEFQ